MKDSGLIEYWYSQYQPDISKCGHKFSSKAAYTQAKMVDFIGIFLLLFFGLASATIAFVCEHLMQKIIVMNVTLVSSSLNS